MPDLIGEKETRKALADGKGKTFPNAEEAIKWLKSKPTLEEAVDQLIYARSEDRIALARYAVAQYKEEKRKELGVLGFLLDEEKGK